MRLKILLIVPALMVLSACKSFHPLPIDDSAKLPDEAQSIPEVKAQMKTLGDAYIGLADRQRKRQYQSGDISLAGGLIGVAGGIAGSVGAAVAGAVIGTGPSLFSNRYQFAAQALNFEKASKAMYCMRTKLLFVTNNNNDLIVYANEQIRNVHFRLRTVQAKIDLSGTDVTALEAAILKALEKKKNVEGLKSELLLASQEVAKLRSFHSAQGVPFNSQGQGQFSDPKSTEALVYHDWLARKNSLQTDLATENLEKLKADLAKCVAAF